MTIPTTRQLKVFNTMIKTYVAAIDQGTTSTRCILFNKIGEIISDAQKEHQQIYPQPGWCEHDPMEIWQNTQTVVHEAISKAKVETSQVVAVGITNQRETTVLWDRETGKPLYNAIVWHDARTNEIVKRLKETDSDDMCKNMTGLPIATYFSASKLIWMMENCPGVREKCEQGKAMFGTIDSWLIWNLTGGLNGGLHLTDVTNASRTMLMNLETQTWDDKLLQWTNIPANVLPAICASSDKIATCTVDSCLPNIPIAGILGDQQAALFGQTCFQPGEAKNTYGTGCFLMMNTGDKIVPSNSGLLTTVAYKIGNNPTQFALEGSVAIAGALIQWLRDNLKLIENAPEVESLAKQVADNGGVYLVPAFGGLFAPHWRDDARGVLVGLTAYCNRNHIARASLESVAYQTMEVVDAMEKDVGQPMTSLKVDGGMTVNELLMQFQSDMLDVEVVRPQVLETTALGAAYAAGLAVGYWKDLDDLKANWKVDKTWTSTFDGEKRSLYQKKWTKAVERTLNWEDN